MRSWLSRLGVAWALLLQVTCSSPTAAQLADPVPTPTLALDPNGPLRYVALGDSTVEGVGATSPETTYVGRIFARLQERYPAAELTNLGVSGANAADVVRDQLPRAVALHPQLVTLSVGPNDITQGRPLDAFTRDVDTIFRTLNQADHPIMVVNLLPDLSLAPTFDDAQRPAVAQLTVAFNQALQTLGEQYGVTIVDLYSASQEEVPDAPSLVSADQYHPSDAGYARWAEYMWRAIEPRLPA